MTMPRKIRQLKSGLRKAGFMIQAERGKGSHAVWEHPDAEAASVTLSGKDGADARSYQEMEVREAIVLAQQASQPPR